MSFGMTRAMVDCHVVDLRRHAARKSPNSSATDETGPSHSGNHSFGRLQDRIGLALVEVGLHLLVRAQASTRPLPPQASLFRPSSGSPGR
jgi:hypothetical protein